MPWSQTKRSLKDLKAEVELSFKRADAVISLKRRKVSKSRSGKRTRIEVSAPLKAEPCFRILPENGPTPG